MARELYPEELKGIADLIEKMNEIDAEIGVGLQSGVTVLSWMGSTTDPEPIGTLVDLVGGAWAFVPLEKEPTQ